MQNRYRPINTPAGTKDVRFDCSECGRQEVKNVWLTDGSGPRPFGRGCAAKLLGWSHTTTTPASFDRRLYEALETHKREVVKAEREARNYAWQHPSKESIARAKALTAAVKELLS